MTNIVTLKQLCAELKVDPCDAREKLRRSVKDPQLHPELAKTHKPRQPWQWAKGSTAEKEARSALKTG